MPIFTNASSTASKTVDASYQDRSSHFFAEKVPAKIKPEVKAGFNTDVVGKAKKSSYNLGGLIGGRSNCPPSVMAKSEMEKSDFGKGVPGCGLTPAFESQVGKTIGADPTRGQPPAPFDSTDVLAGPKTHDPRLEGS